MQFTQKAIPVTSKTVYYGADGTGRDSYIKIINGGLLTQDRLHELKPQKVISVDRMEFQKKKYHRTLPPKSDNKVVNYYSDGSGRDYYVCINNGGRSDTSYHWRNQVDFKFNSSLRQYDKIPHSFQRDLWRESQQGFRNQKNQRQLSQEKSIAQEQMNQTMRLSRPKTEGRNRCLSFQERSRTRELTSSPTRNELNISPNKTELYNKNHIDTLRNDKDFIKKKLSSTLTDNILNKSVNHGYNKTQTFRQNENNLSFYK